MVGEEMLASCARDALAFLGSGEEMLEPAAQLVHAAVAGEVLALDVLLADFIDPVGEEKRARRRDLEEPQVHRAGLAEPIVDVEVDLRAIIDLVGARAEGRRIETDASVDADLGPARTENVQRKIG